MLEEWRKEWCSTEKGKHLRKIDSDCHPSELNDYMVHYPGVEHTYSHNFEPATLG